MSTRRRLLLGIFGALAASTVVRAQNAAPGVVLLHGKQGMPMFAGLRAVASKLEATGLRTALPEMPWSRTRYLDGNAERAFDEIAAALGTLKRTGAAGRRRSCFRAGGPTLHGRVSGVGLRVWGWAHRNGGCF